MTDLEAWKRAANILCIRLDSIGDVLMTTPALRAVKESGSNRQVTLLTSPAGAAVARLNPHIDAAIAYDAPWLKGTAEPDAARDLEMIRRLAERRYDAAVVFTVFSQSALPAALVCHLANIPLRLAHVRENPYRLLTTWVRDPEPTNGIRHEVERQLALVQQVGYHASDTHLVLRVPDDARAAADRLLRSAGIGANERWIVLHPGASAPSRRYPADRFAEAARLIAMRRDCRVVVTGDASERTLVAEVCDGIGARAVGLPNRVDLAVFAALIEASPLLITNNTGPAHIAAAVGTPVVDVYALTNPQHTPWRVKTRVLSHDVPCRNCFKSVCPEGHHNCLRLIPPADLVEAAHDLLMES
jgi:lipopolysaccharide heptosyltransferase II